MNNRAYSYYGCCAQVRSDGNPHTSLLSIHKFRMPEVEFSYLSSKLQ